MSDRVEFQRRARACVRLAQAFGNPEQKAAMLDIADLWMRLAERADERQAVEERAVAEAARAAPDGQSEEEHRPLGPPLVPSSSAELKSE
jgi:hypothetical protein